VAPSGRHSDTYDTHSRTDAAVSTLPTRHPDPAHTRADFSRVQARHDRIPVAKNGFALPAPKSIVGRPRARIEEIDERTSKIAH